MNPSPRRNFIRMISALLAGLPFYARPSRADSPGDSPHAAADLKLWFDKPAAKWIDALPLGNGRLGAMVFGGGESGELNREVLALNEDTLWSGKPRDGNNPDAKNHLAAIRKAVLEQQDYHRADELCKKMQGRFGESYQPLGNLKIDFAHAPGASGYRRELDLDAACSRVEYTIDDLQFVREAFVSAPDQVVVLRIAVSNRAL